LSTKTDRDASVFRFLSTHYFVHKKLQLLVIESIFSAIKIFGIEFMNKPVAPVRVWDLPTRLFHWILTVCVAVAIASAYIGGSAMEWHFRMGYAILALLLFRLVWGVVGGRWSRFANFVRGPMTILEYLRGQAPERQHHDVGHNPLGALSVVALLAVLTFQVVSGLMSDDEIANVGPLAKFVGTDLSLAFTRFHTNVGQWAVIGLVVLHVAAIAFYYLHKKHNLLLPMLTGDKELEGTVPSSADSYKTRLQAVVVLGICVGLAGLIASL
jgi:cytochrome b